MESLAISRVNILQSSPAAEGKLHRKLGVVIKGSWLMFYIEFYSYSAEVQPHSHICILTLHKLWREHYTSDILG